MNYVQPAASDDASCDGLSPPPGRIFQTRLTCAIQFDHVSLLVLHARVLEVGFKLLHAGVRSLPVQFGELLQR